MTSQSYKLIIILYFCIEMLVQVFHLKIDYLKIIAIMGLNYHEGSFKIGHWDVALDSTTIAKKRLKTFRKLMKNDQMYS